MISAPAQKTLLCLLRIKMIFACESLSRDESAYLSDAAMATERQLRSLVLFSQIVAIPSDFSISVLELFYEDAIVVARRESLCMYPAM